MAKLLSDIKPGNCILFATADWDEPYWTNKQHTANELAKRGWKVLYIESVGLRPPRSGSARDWGRLKDRFWKGLKSLFLGAPKRAPGIWVLSPLMIPAGHTHLVWGVLNRWLLQAAIARFRIGKRFCNPLIWTYHPYMLEVIADENRTSLLYHCVDDLAAVPGVDAKAFRQAEETLLRSADIVYATAPALAERCRAINPNTYYFPNVVDADHFGKAMQPGPLPSELSAIPEPRLVYHGVLSDFKLDFQLVHKAAILKPAWHWVFIGEEREGQKNKVVEALATLPNVHFLGYRPYHVLPDYLRGMSVGLLPTALNEYTRSMFPMKYFEYLAAGLPVASTPLDFTSVHRAGLESGQTPNDFLDAVDRQLRRGRLSPDEIEAMVGDNTWRARTGKMLQTLFELQART